MYSTLSNELWMKYLKNRKANNMDNSAHRNLMGYPFWKDLKYFKKEEFACPCGCGIRMDKDFVFRLDSLRAGLGFPIKINSAYRCKDYNKKIGGAPNSKHIQGLAVDIHVVNGNHRYKLLTEVMKMRFSGIGFGNTFLHIDDRVGNQTTWTY